MNILADNTDSFQSKNRTYGKKQNVKLIPVSIPGSEFIPKKLLDEWKANKSDKQLKPRITRDDIPKSIPYESSDKPANLVNMAKKCHNGQNKLLLTEIQALTMYIDSLDEQLYVIYAGAAPSNKLWMYMSMFPNIKFILVDPNEFQIYVNNVHHNSHYEFPGKEIVYMRVSDKSNINKRYTDNNIPRMVSHYLDPSNPVDKKDLDESLEWDEDSMIDYIQSSHHQVYIFEDYMTPKLSRSLGKLIADEKKVLFWSDIRTNVGEQGTSPTDIDVIANAAMNYTWLKLLTENYKSSEFYSMLKFRVPYFDAGEEIDWYEFYDNLKSTKDEGVDYKLEMTGMPLADSLEEERNAKKAKCVNSMPWFRGDIYIQAYAGVSSAETRLHSNLEDIRADLVKHSLPEHEDKMFYYNKIERFGYIFENPYSSETLKFDHCGDCSIAASIWSDFIDKFYPPMSDEKKTIKIHELVETIGSLSGRPLTKTSPHGYKFP